MNEDGFNFAWNWKRSALPSIHMPRWASRITLEVISVRVERLQNISEDDAKAEGIQANEAGLFLFNKGDGSSLVCETAVAAYRELWELINGPGSWEKNPWVWCVEFKRVVPTSAA